MSLCQVRAVIVQVAKMSMVDSGGNRKKGVGADIVSRTTRRAPNMGPHSRAA